MQKQGELLDRKRKSFLWLEQRSKEMLDAIDSVRNGGASPNLLKPGVPVRGGLSDLAADAGKKGRRGKGKKGADH